MSGNNIGLYGNTSSTGNVSGSDTMGLYGTTGSFVVTSPYGNADVQAFLESYTGYLQSGSLTVSGPANVGAIYTDNYYYANGQPFVTSNYGNANVVDLLGSGTLTTNISTSGYYFGNAAYMTGIPASYGNANVAAYLPTYLPTYTGNLGAGNITVTGTIGGSGARLTNIPGANVTGTVPVASTATTAITVTGNAQPNITSVGTLTSLTSTGTITGANLVANTRITVNGTGGNITGANYVSANYYVGDGGLLSNVTSSYGNANVASYLPTYTGALNPANVSATGNITGSYFFGNAAFMTGIPASYGNANVAAYLPTYTGNIGANTITATGNISSGNLSTTNITATGVITATGNIQAGNVITDGRLLFGTDTPEEYISADNLTMSFVTNNNIRLSVTSGNSIFYQPIWVTGGNIRANSGNIIASDGVFGNTGSFTGNVTANHFSGNGSLLTNINGSNITGAVANATYATTANLANYATTAFNVAGANVTGAVANATYADTANLATYATTAFNINGSNVSGQVANALVAGTVYTNAQPNITSVGSLTGLTVSGQLNATDISTTGNVTILGNLYSDDVTSTSVTVYGDQVITGNLTVQGTTTTINSNTIVTNDKTITVANNQSTQANVDGAGLEAGNPAVATWYYNGLTNTWQANIGITPTANAAFDLGKPTNQWATIYGTTANVTGNVNAGNVVVSGIVQAAYLIGDGSNITGVTTAAASTQIPIKNTSGNIIPQGTPVYSTGTVGASTTLEVAPSRADTPATMPCVGLTTTTLAVNGVGYAISVGTLKNVDTSVYTAGQTLYVAAAGGLTAARPTGTNLVQSVGSVGRVDASNGSIETNIWNYFQLPNLGNGNVWVGNATGFPTEQVAYGNANVATYLASGTDTQNITTSGNVSGGYIIGNGSLLTNLTAGNIVGTVANATYATTANLANFATTAFNVSGANVSGAVANATYATTANLANYATTAFNVSGANVTGTVANATYADTANVSNYSNSVAGANVTGTVANATYATSAGSATTAVTVTGNAQANITSVGTLTGLTVSGNIATGNILTDGYYYANGSPFVAGSNYGNANVAAYLPTYTGDLGAANITFSGVASGSGAGLTNLPAANITGTVANATYALNANAATYAGTVTTNAQPNITSVGTLTNLSVTGNVTSGYFIGDGSQLTGITASAILAGNLSGDLVGNGYGIANVSYLTSTGNITGTNILGNGYNLTGINSFGNIAITGQTTVSADNATDTLTLVAGTNITLTTDAANNKITITSTAAAGDTLSPFLLMGG